MVKTRHSADADDLAYGEFITIATSGTPGDTQMKSHINGYEEDDSEQDSEVEIGLKPTGRTRHQRNLTMFGGSTTDDETPPRNNRGLRRRYRKVPSECRPDPGSSGGRVSRHIRHEAEEGEIRRGTRQRKLTYGTLNQSLIDKQMIYMNGYEEVEKPPKRMRKESEVSEPEKEENDGLDMYSRVKRDRRQVKRNIYGVPIEEETKEGSDISESSADDEEEEDEVNQEQNSRSYFLREHKPRTQVYSAPIEPKRSRAKASIFRESTPPPRNVRRTTSSYRSPARKNVIRRKRAAFHGNSSTSSSSSNDGSDDERRFERRKAKSMNKSRQRCLPMNLAPEDVSTGILRDRTKIGASLADIDPMNLDRSVTFDSVGGLGKHVRALKEMVVFPLLYPEVFERFKIAPPRGVLFYGPPGTGKTLVARALANECSSGERRVAFFMRKGADCLSKWVGESERQLRLLFDQAYQMRPSIIFFDEIDGLAPVRSSRQDQIHSSIVSTLLALMDGLDSRGEIVVIGATNRIDAIDPALRRPGRFDREFLFPLPSVQARRQILQIHTKHWVPKLSDAFLGDVAERCVGYCGADLKAMCTETALHALRRRYPQIYTSQDKLELDVQSIIINAKDFEKAMQIIIPTAQRSVTSPARALSPAIRPLLQVILSETLQALQRIFPVSLAQLSSVDAPGTNSGGGDGACVDEDFCSDDEEDGPDIYDCPKKTRGRKKLDITIDKPESFSTFSCSAHKRPATHRPRLLLSGSPGQGQTSHLAPSVLHCLERMPVQVMDLPALFAVSTKTSEEACAQIFREARKTCPSIIYIPHIETLWEVIGDTLRATFLTLLEDLDPSAPLLVLATTDQPMINMPNILCSMFSSACGEVIEMRNPSENERREFFDDLLLRQAVRAPPTRKQAAQRVLEELPRAPPPKPRELTEAELEKLRKQEEVTLRELRLFLRDTLNKLGRDRKFGIFAKPVDEEEVLDYYEIITNPMDLSTMMTKIDLHKYQTVNEFMDDIELIVSNALEYNPEKDPTGRAIRHRACTLKDTAQAILQAELDEEFEKLCEEIKEARQRRGEKPTATVPAYYFTKPLGRGMQNLLPGNHPSPEKYPSRYSRRARGMEAEDDEPELDAADPDKPLNVEIDDVPKIRTIVKRIRIRRATSKKFKSPWLKPKRIQYRKVIVYLDEHGNEIPQENEEKQKDDNDEETKSDKKEVNEESNEQNGVEDEEKESDGTDHQDPEICFGPVHSPREEKRDDNPRAHSPRGGRSPRADKSPCASASPQTGKSPEPNRGRPRSRDSKEVEETESKKRNRSTSSHLSDHEAMETAESKTTAHNPTVGNSPKKAAAAAAHTPTKITTSAQKTNSPTKKAQSEGKDDEQKKEDGAISQEEKEEPALRVLRSQSNPAHRQRAIEILQQASKNVTIDETRLHQLLDKIVHETEGCKVNELEKLYSMLSQCIYQHRHDFNKDQLVQDLEGALKKFSCYR